MFCKFIAGKVSSESLGIISVSFNQTTMEIVNNSGETTLETVRAGNSSAFHIVKQDYDSPLSFTLQVINEDASDIDAVKEREITRSLCKRGIYLDFVIDDDRYYNLVLKANISNPKIIRIGKVYGMEFTVTCKYPYAHSRIIKKTFNITTENQQIRLFVNHDDDNYIYPNIEIILNTSGNLTITNIKDTKIFSISNVSNGEKIKIDGLIPLISTSISSHAIWQNFNKNWLRLVDGMNTLTINIPCTLTLSYQEARKVGI
jgi:hypothetical protein